MGLNLRNSAVKFNNLANISYSKFMKRYTILNGKDFDSHKKEISIFTGNQLNNKSKWTSKHIIFQFRWLDKVIFYITLVIIYKIKLIKAENE